MYLPLLSGGVGVSRLVSAGMDAASRLSPIPLVVVANGGVGGGGALLGGGVAAVVTTSAVAATSISVVPTAGSGTVRAVIVRVRHIINL